MRSLLRVAAVLPATISVVVETSLSARQTSEEPCAQLSQAASSSSQLPADLTLQCLRSVPLAKKENAAQLAGLKTFAQFQSDLEYLRDRSQGFHPGVDILQSLDDLADDLENDEYDNEYDFQLDVYNLFDSAYDGHLVYMPDIIGVFAFARPGTEDGRFNATTGQLEDDFPLFSVSENGTALPDVYGYRDLEALLDSDSADYTPSAVSHINGDDVQAWLNAYAMQNSRSDPDAGYNSLFFNMPLYAYQGGGDSQSSFPVSRHYQGTETILTFENGTDISIDTVAYLAVDESLENVTDGQSFFEQFCNNDINALLSNTSEAVDPTNNTMPSTTQVPYEPVSTDGVTPPVSPYPSPIVVAGDRSVAGYLPEDDTDLAVLSIPSFNPEQMVDFENTVRQLLATANANNRTRLVIDLRGNSGGRLLLAHDTFRQLFPSIIPYSTSNYRAHDLFNFTGTIVSGANDDALAAVPDVETSNDLSWVLYPFNYRTPLDASNDSFPSWSDFYGPRQTDAQSDSYTSLARYDLSIPGSVSNPVPILGYGNHTQPQPQTFLPENILLVHDGQCASTCAVFTEMLKTQLGVRSLAVGGRRQTGPMQGVGGTKGSQVQTMLQLYSVVGIAASAAGFAAQLALLQDYGSEEGNLLQITQAVLSRAHKVVESGGATGTVNFQNHIRQGDEGRRPLQFVYEAADCRIFYTAEMFARQEVLWTRAAEVMWREGGMEGCVRGSTGWESSRNGTGYFGEGPPEVALNMFGARGRGLVNGSLSGEAGSADGGNSDGGNGGDGSSSSGSSGNGESGDGTNNESAASGRYGTMSAALVAIIAIVLLSI